jgi:hypothetical protein
MDQLVALAGTVASDFEVLNRVSTAAFDFCRDRFDWADRAAALRAFATELGAGRDAPRLAS